MAALGDSPFGLMLDVVSKDDLTYDVKIWDLHWSSGR